MDCLRRRVGFALVPGFGERRKAKDFVSAKGYLRHLVSSGLGLLVMGAMALAATNRGAIRGTLTDPQGGVVPKAQITITNIDTGVQQLTQTNSAGFYFVPELVPGPYRVRFEMAGFVPVDVDRVEVKAEQTATVDMQLRVGPTSQHVEVVAAAPLVDTTASNFNVPVEQRYMQELPVEGRDIQNLVMLIPGVTQSNGPPGTLVGFNGGQFGGFPDPSHIVGSQLAINGSQSSANLWYLDGNLNSAEGVDNVVVNPAPDAVSEFQAITNGFAPEHGRTAGGVFNVVVKSGANSLHGDLYEYNRNSYFESRNPFQGTDASGKVLPPNYVNWNQFGGTIGGPVEIPHIYHGKNRTFFFAGWDLSRLVEKAPGGIFTVPTLLERQGNFSEFPGVSQFGIFDPLSTVPGSKTGTSSPFDRTAFGTPAAGDPNGCLASHIQASGGTSCALATSLPSGRIDPVALWFLNQYPTPNFLDPRQQNAAAGGCLNTCNNFQGNYASGQNTHNVVIKVDHQISQKHKLFGEWLYNPTYYSLLKLPWSSATVPLLGFNGAFPFDVKEHVAALGDTISFNPTTINEFRFSYSRIYNIPLAVPNSLQDTKGTLQHLNGLNIPEFPPYIPVPLWSIGGLGGFGAPSNNLVQITQAATVLDNLTKVHGKHTVKAGFMFRTDLTGTILPSSSDLNFGGGLTTSAVTGAGGSGVAQFLLGTVDQSSFVRVTPSTIGSNHTWSFFVQDDYRVTPKLTVNVGLRYDMYGWFDDRHDHASIFDFNIQNPKDPVRKGGIVYFATPAHPSRRAFPPNYGDFAPRLNFAYTPFNDRKTVIRGGIDLVYTNGNTQLNGQGYGASEDPGYQAFVSWITDATGQGLEGSNVVPAFILSKGAPSLNLTPPDPKKTNEQLLGAAGGGALTQVKLPRDPNVLFWNLQIERELPGNFSVSAAYVGSKGTDLIGGRTYFNYVPTAIRLKLRSQLNNFVPMPADLVPLFGQDYYASQLYMQYPQYSGVGCGGGCGTGGASAYDAFQLKVERRFSQGLQFKVAYTAQKTIVDPGIGGYFSNTWTGGANWGNGRGRTFQLGALSGIVAGQDPDNWKGDRTLAEDDIPQIFNTAWTYELPFGPGKPFAGHASGVPRLLVQGWKISGNFNAQTGVPLNFSGPCNSLAAATPPSYACRPNLIGDPNAGRGSKTRYQQEQQWFNPNAFEAVFGSDPAIIALATNGTNQQKDAHDEFWRFGTAGLRLGNARSPSFWDVDMALSKDFKVSEAKYLQLRVESYNALNHQSLGLPSTYWCLPPNPDGSTDAVHQFGCQFGKIYAVQRDPRALEFGLKFVF